MKQDSVGLRSFDFDPFVAAFDIETRHFSHVERPKELAQFVLTSIGKQR